ncbi:MAG: hypothetical protein WC117_05410 [Sphaerochaetaceae bacterium]
MKKIIVFVCMLLCAASLFAGVTGVVNFKPYFTYDNSPAAIASDAGNLSTWNIPSDWWENKHDYLLKPYAVPSLLDLGFEVDTKNIDMVFVLDIRQDALQILKDDGKLMTNIPFVGAVIDLNMPRVGYVDFTSNDSAFYASIGRRQIKWGPSEYDMAISDSQPYLDNAFIRFDAAMNNGWNFWYNFIGIAYKLFMDYGTDVGPKSTFAHRIGFENSNFRIAIAELNNVYNKYPTLLDFTPFGLWHDNYQDNYSNVMLNVSLEGLAGPVRLFGTFTMDDFDLPHEKDNAYGLSNKPQAMGFNAGAEVNLLNGEEIVSSEFEYSDYALREQTFKKNTGLNLGYEFYYCSTFMYNRNDDAGKFTVPFQFISLTGNGYSYDENAYYLGFKYGPNTMVHRVYAEYKASPFEAELSAELIKRGSYGIDDEYSTNAYFFSRGLKTMQLTDPVTTALKVDAGAAYSLQKGFKVCSTFSYSRDLTHKTQAMALTIGASIAVCDVDWKNLF